MASDTLTRLLKGARPFKPFPFDTVGDDGKAVQVMLYARRASAAEVQMMSDEWENAYQHRKLTFQDTESDLSSAFDKFNRQNDKQLVRFISMAERRDILEEASSLCEDKALDDPEVVTMADTLEKTRKEELEKLSHDMLVGKAMDRRSHFAAMTAGNIAMTKALALSMLYQDEVKDNNVLTGEKIPLFDTQSITEAPFDLVQELVAKATEALSTPPADPLA